MRLLKNSRLLLVMFIALLFVGATNAQNIAINKSGATADESAILDLQSDEQGFLTPRMTTTQRTAISTPANGLLIFDTNTNSFWFYKSSTWTELNSGPTTLVADEDGNTKIQVEETANENNIRFDTDGSESMVLTNEGKLGIGVAAPSGFLHVKTDAIPAEQNTAAAVTSSNTGMYGTSTVYQSFTSAEDGILNTFTINPNGLHSCAGTVSVYAGNGTGGSVLGSKAFSYNNTNNAPINFTFTDLNINLTAGSQYTVAFHNFTSGTFRHTGNTNNLHTGGNYYSNVYNSPSGWDMRFTVLVGTPATAAQDIVISDNGKVGIRTTTPTYTLHVNGTVAGTSAFTNLSDRRYKKDVKPLENALEKINQVEGVSFDWRHADFPKMNFSKGREIGFIAQDLKPLFPEIVNQDKEGYHSVEYANLVPVLVEAVKELTQKLESAELKIEEQSAQLTALEKSQKMLQSEVSSTTKISFTNNKSEPTNHE